MQVKVKLIPTESGKTVELPAYQSKFSAGADLCACIDEPLTVAPHTRALVPSGIAIEPSDVAVGAFIFARSGLGIKHGIAPRNCVGVIDSDYRGEVCVGLMNNSDEDYVIQPLDRIAQMAIMPVMAAEYIEADELSDTERGKGGFGSTGK